MLRTKQKANDTANKTSHNAIIKPAKKQRNDDADVYALLLLILLLAATFLKTFGFFPEEETLPIHNPVSLID